MNKSIVHLEDKAFMAILLSSAEAYPTKFRRGWVEPDKKAPKEGEAYGLLFGQCVRSESRCIYNVTLAIPSQIIYSRTPNGVTASVKHIELIRDLANIFPIYQFLGTYHSHPWSYKELEDDEAFDKKTATDPSDVDDESATNAASEIGENLLEIILGVTHLKNKARINPEFIENHLIHNCCGNYKYTLGCYITDVSEKRLTPVTNLICPTAAGMHYTDFKN